MGAGWLCAASGIASNRTRRGRWVVKGRSPEGRDQTVAGLEAVIVVTGEVFREKGFFVEEAPDDRGEQRRKEEQRPIGAEGERDKGEQDQGGGVHGVADEAVGAGGDNFLTGRDFDGGRGEAVLAEDEEDEVEAEGDEEVGRDGEEGRDGGPVKAVVEAGEGEEEDEENVGERLDDFLAAALFGGGAGAEAALDEVGVALEEVGGNQKGRCDVDKGEEPCLPEIERPGGDE